ncbi:MAG: DUF1631 domain-containing protein [Gammaproteobacteria bacterium]|nr:MAG: DUF1631 domain-containing protein [Gammaproteobacteria bacterium]
MFQGILRMDAIKPQHKHIAELRKSSLEFSDKLLSLYLPALEAILLEMADATRGSEQMQLLALVRDFKAKRDMLAGDFKHYIAEGFLQFQQKTLGNKTVAEEPEDLSTDLSLIANDELEQELAAAGIARRATARYAELLQALNQRMAVVNGGERLLEDGNPLGPYQFTHALKHALQLIDLQGGSMPLQAYKLFEKRFIGQLEPFYKAANQYLIDHDILPNLRPRRGGVINKPTPTAPAKSSPQEAASHAEVAATAVAPVAQSPAMPANATARAAESIPAVNATAENALYQAIRQAQQGVSAPLAASETSAAAMPQAQVPVTTGSGMPQGAMGQGQPGVSPVSVQPTPASQPAASSPVAAANYQPGYFSSPAFGGQYGAAGEGAAPVALCAPGEVAGALQSVSTVGYADTLEQSDVPHALTPAHFQLVTTQIKNEIGNDKRLSDDEGRVIDLVGMIFEYMLGDKNLPDAVKAVLSYLHTPYLKVAFIDGHMFEQPEHSSRQLLNCLAEAGSRWVNAKGESQFRVFSKIKEVVRRILKEFDDDLGLFDELLAEVQEFNRTVERGVALMERRAREKAQGEERLREGKRRALTELKQRMAGHDLPSYCIVLLLHPWLDYLTFNLLRHGEKSAEWNAALQMVDDIIWSIRPPDDEAQRDVLRQMTEGIYKAVSEGLETVGYDPVRAQGLLERLRQTHGLALQSQAVEVAEPAQREQMEAEVTEQLGGDEPDPALLSQAEQDLVEKLRLMEYGTWFEFDELDDYHFIRAKVSWFNASTSRYLLVDLSGKQLAMKGGLDIARLVLAGKARMISGSAKPFFERALENILARLRDSMASAHPAT